MSETTSRDQDINLNDSANRGREDGSVDADTTCQLPFVSVVIPVFNDLKGLAGCLTAVQEQTWPGNAYEIIVVDNGSAEDLNPLKLASRYPQVRFLSETKPGSYAARNCGVHVARGEIIAFTDADCVPKRGWLENGVKTMMDHPGLGLLAGDIEVFVQHPGPPTAVEIYEQAVAFDPVRLLRTKRYGVTANLFTFRSVLDRIGLFDEGLNSGGDLEWGQRVHAAGLKQVFSADACVAHPARSSFADLRRRTVRFAGAKSDLLARKKKTWTSRQIQLLGSVTLELIAIPCAFLFHITADRRVRGLRNRFKYASVSAWVRSVALAERVRVSLGKTSSRT